MFDLGVSGVGGCRSSLFTLCRIIGCERTCVSMVRTSRVRFTTILVGGGVSRVMRLRIRLSARPERERWCESCDDEGGCSSLASSVRLSQRGTTSARAHSGRPPVGVAGHTPSSSLVMTVVVERQGSTTYCSTCFSGRGSPRTRSSLRVRRTSWALRPGLRSLRLPSEVGKCLSCSGGPVDAGTTLISSGGGRVDRLGTQIVAAGSRAVADVTDSLSPTESGAPDASIDAIDESDMWRPCLLYGSAGLLVSVIWAVISPSGADASGVGNRIAISHQVEVHRPGVAMGHASLASTFVESGARGLDRCGSRRLGVSA